MDEYENLIVISCKQNSSFFGPRLQFIAESKHAQYVIRRVLQRMNNRQLSVAVGAWRGMVCLHFAFL